MPDYKRLHQNSALLATLTNPNQSQTQFASWTKAVLEIWKDIAEQWDPERPSQTPLKETEAQQHRIYALEGIVSAQNEALDHWRKAYDEVCLKLAACLKAQSWWGWTNAARHPFAPGTPGKIGLESLFCKECGTTAAHPIHQGETHAR